MRQKHKGFTFAEVLISLAILAGSIYIYSGLQFRASIKTLTSTEEIERIFFIKKELYQLYLNPPTTDKPIKVSLEEPNITIQGHTQEIDKRKSALKDFEKEIDIIWTTGEWSRGQDKHNIKMISFVQKQKNRLNEKKYEKD